MICAILGSCRSGLPRIRAALLAASILLAGAGSTSAVPLHSVQSGSATVSSGSSSAVVPITAVDPAKAFLVFTLRHDIDNPADSMVTGQLVGNNSLTFQRVGTSTDVTLEWSVVEFLSGVTVQRGSLALDAPTKNVTISSVDLSKSFPLVTQRIGGTVTSDDDFIRTRLTSSTNLEIAAFNDRGDSTAEWQVIEYTDASVQTGSVSFASGDSSKSAVLPSAVDTGKTWLVYSYRSELGTVSDTGQKLVRGLITGPTGLQFDRDRTGQAIDLEWCAVEFEDLTVVRHASAGFTSGQLQADVPISAVTPSRSIAVGGYSLRSGKTPFNTTDHTGPAWFTAELTSPTNLRLRRDTTGSQTADLGWFVIQFSPELSIVKRAFQLDGTPIPDGTTVPSGIPVKFLLYVDNPGGLVEDTSLQDALAPLFTHFAGTIRYDNSVASCATDPCTPAEEAAIFAAADTGATGTPAIDGDVVSFAGTTLDIGDASAANAQLDLAGGKVWAVTFEVRVQ